VRTDSQVEQMSDASGPPSVTGAADLRKAFQEAFQERGYPVAFVGSDVEKLKIFNVLTELKLARRIGPIPARGSNEEKEAEAKFKVGLKPNQIKDKATGAIFELVEDKDGLKPNQIKDEATGAIYELVEDKDGLKPNQIKDEATGAVHELDILKPNQIKDEENGVVYQVDNRPSVIISITGDALDLPEDRELEEAVTSLTKVCREKELQTFVLSSEVAHRAILANYVYREDQITKNYINVEEHKAKLESLKEVKSMLISYLLEIRIQELENRIKVQDEISPKIQLLSKCFKYASVRDVLLDISKKLEENVSRLWSLFNLPVPKLDKQLNLPQSEPVSSVKRLSKNR
jgi:hypothetical protein